MRVAAHREGADMTREKIRIHSNFQVPPTSLLSVCHVPGSQATEARMRSAVHVTTSQVSRGAQLAKLQTKSS
jgi:hypothetical protein